MKSNREKGTEYEIEVYKYFKKKYPESEVTHDAELDGKITDTKRQIDVLIETDFLDFSLKIAIECKNWNKKLDVNQVSPFIQMMKDVEITKGIMISKIGYTPAAEKLIQNEPNLRLEIMNFEELKDVHGFWGVPYRGCYAALMSAPMTWVVNNNIPEDMLPHILCYLHPLKGNIQFSPNSNQFIYVNILPFTDLKEYLESQEDELKEEMPGIEFMYEKYSKFPGEVKKILLRVDSNENNQFVGISGGLTSAECSLLVFSQCNKENAADRKEKMISLLKNTQLIKASENCDPMDSHHVWKELIDFKLF